MPRIAFLRLMHLGVAAAVLVLGRTRGRDDARIDNRAGRYLQPDLLQVRIDRAKQRIPQSVGFEQ